jgi:beta-ureidopropionase
MRVLFGLNLGQPVGTLALPEPCTRVAYEANFDLQAACFRAAPEQLRAPRLVRIGLVQNMIVLPTHAPFEEQAQVR